MSRPMKDSGIAWVREIPSSWDVKPNKYVMTKKKRICPLYKGEQILSLTMNGVVVRDLDNLTGKRPASFDGYQRIQQGNLLMCLFDIDVTPRCIGLITQDGLTSPAYSQFCMTDKAVVNYYYYYYLMLDYTKELLHLAKNLRHSLTEDQLGAIKVPVPPVSEQQRIADYLDKKCAGIDTLSNSIQQQIDTLEQYKQAVITETVTKGLNPSAPMKDSGIPWIGQIPKHWDCHPLYYYFTERNRPNRFGKENNLLSLSYGKIIKKDINTCEGLLPTSYNSYNIIDPLDIVLRLTDLQNDKRSLRTGLSHERGIITSAYVTIKPARQVVPTFFHYLLHAYDVGKVLYNMGNGVRQSLNYAELSKLPLIEPPTKEQQAIAEYLDNKCSKIDTIIQDKQQQLEKLEQYKKATIFEYVTGKKQVPEV